MSLSERLGLTGKSFADVDEEITQRLIVNFEAHPKCGKTSMALTAPDPIIIYNGDRGLEGVVQRAIKNGKRIIVSGIPGTGKFPHYGLVKPTLRKGENTKSGDYTSRMKALAKPIWEQFVADYYEGLKSKAKTLVLDTGTWFWLLARYAHWGAISPPGAKFTGTLKDDFSTLVTDAQDYDKNVIWLHRLRAEYVNDQKTERFERAGHSEIGYDVHANVRLWKEVKRETVKKRLTLSTKFGLTVVDCRLNSGLDGVELEGEMCSFPYLAAMVFENEPEEWGA